MTLEQVTRLSHEVPEKHIVKELENAIILHKEYNTEQTKLKVLTYCMMVISNDMCKRNGVEKTIIELKNLSQISDRLNGCNN